MDLKNIVIEDERQRQDEDFMSAIKNLPSETIQGGSIIEAQKKLFPESIELHVMYLTQGERDAIKLTLPDGAVPMGKPNDKLRFRYNGRDYIITREAYLF